MKNKKNSLVGTIVFVVLLAAVIIGVFLKLTSGKDDSKFEADVESSDVEILLAKDMERDYPQTAREVLKLYCRISKCLYNADLTERQTEELVDMLRKLYSDELLENNPRENMLLLIESDIKDYHKAGTTINSYTIDSASKNKTISDDHSTRVLINMFFTIKKKTSMERTYEEFVIKENDAGQWKILGWKQISPVDIVE